MVLLSLSGGLIAVLAQGFSLSAFTWARVVVDFLSLALSGWGWFRWWYLSKRAEGAGVAAEGLLRVIIALTFGIQPLPCCVGVWSSDGAAALEIPLVLGLTWVLVGLLGFRVSGGSPAGVLGLAVAHLLWFIVSAVGLWRHDRGQAPVVAPVVLFSFVWLYVCHGVVALVVEGVYRSLVAEDFLAAEVWNKSRTIQSLATSISHAIRTPLNIISGTAELVLEAEPSLGPILEQCRVLSSRADDLLCYAQLSSGTLQLSLREFNLCKLIFDLEQKWGRVVERTDNELSLRWLEVQPRPWCLPPGHWRLGDCSAVEAVVSQFLENAVKHCRSGPISLSVSDLGEEVVQFCVRDGGEGVAEEKMAELFQPKFLPSTLTGDPRPAPPCALGESTLGLGLSNCAGLAELMGGKVWAQKDPTGGMSFFLSLMLPTISTADKPCPLSTTAGVARKASRVSLASLAGKKQLSHHQLTPRPQASTSRTTAAAGWHPFYLHHPAFGGGSHDCLPDLSVPCRSDLGVGSETLELPPPPGPVGPSPPLLPSTSVRSPKSPGTGQGSTSLKSRRSTSGSSAPSLPSLPSGNSSTTGAPATGARPKLLIVDDLEMNCVVLSPTA